MAADRPRGRCPGRYPIPAEPGKKPGNIPDGGGHKIHGRPNRPYRPQTNGKVERFNRTLLGEWAHAHPYKAETERRHALPRWPNTCLSGHCT